MKWTLLVLAAAFLLGVLYGCATAKQHRQSLEYHTRFFENLMGLPLTSIVFVKQKDMEGFCGHVGYRPIITDKGVGFEGPVIWYALNRDCDPFETALHETCHRRWMHHRMRLSKDVEEAEVQRCVRAYRAKVR